MSCALSVIGMGMHGHGSHSGPVIPLRVSTSPAAKPEMNPYGLAMVPDDFPGGGAIHSGELLISTRPTFSGRALSFRQVSSDPNAGPDFAILDQFEDGLGEIFAYVEDFVSNVTIWSVAQH